MTRNLLVGALVGTFVAQTQTRVVTFLHRRTSDNYSSGTDVNTDEHAPSHELLSPVDS